MEKTLLDLGLVYNLRLLTINECKNYLLKLDLIATGSKVADFTFSFEGELLPRTRLAKRWEWQVTRSATDILV